MPQLKMSSLNVNYFRPNEAGLFALAFPEWRFSKRLPLVCKHIEALLEAGSHVIALQEVHPDYLERMLEFLKSKGLEYYVSPYAYFYLVTAFDPNIYRLTSEPTRLFYTESGEATSAEERAHLTHEEKLKRHLGSEFEKCALFVRLTQIEGETQVLIINTHIDLDPPGLDLSKPEDRARSPRLLAVQKLAQVTQALDENIFIVGDFNSFAIGAPLPSILEQQIKIMLDAGFTFGNECLAYRGSQSTFIAFPGDLGLIKSRLNSKMLLKLEAVIQENDPVILRNFLASICNPENGDFIDLRGGILDLFYVKLRSILEVSRIEIQTTKMFHSGLMRLDNIEDVLAPQRLFANSLSAPLSTELDAVVDTDHYGITGEVVFN